jgi:hypothetical protein
MIFKLEKNCKKRKTHGKSTSKTSKLKKPEAKSMGKKGTSKRESTGEKLDLSIRISFCIYFAFSICFFFWGGAFCLKNSREKQNKRKSKKQIEKAK